MVQFEFFEGIKTNGICNYQNATSANEQKKYKKRIEVGKNSGVSVHFFAKVVNSGPAQFRILAEVIKRGKAVVRDEVSKTTIVEHEGLMEYTNEVQLIDLKGKDSFNYNFITNFETDFKNSVRRQVSAMGGFLGRSLLNTEKLM